MTTARALDALSRRDEFTAPGDYVFAGVTGGPLPENALRDGLYAAMKAAGIDRKAFRGKQGFTFHDLRHTFGTLAVQVWPMSDVKAYMGHANVATTELYAHHVPKRNAAAALTALVDAQRGNGRELDPRAGARQVAAGQ